MFRNSLNLDVLHNFVPLNALSRARLQPNDHAPLIAKTEAQTCQPRLLQNVPAARSLPAVNCL